MKQRQIYTTKMINEGKIRQKNGIIMIKKQKTRASETSAVRRHFAEQVGDGDSLRGTEPREQKFA